MRVVKTEVIDNETGEVFSSREIYGTNNGSGWVINYRQASQELALKCTSAVTFRVFHLLISLQENYGDKGVICSRKWIQNTLNISRKSVYNALVWLIQHRFIIEADFNGMTEFFFNPSKVTIGRDKAKRMRRWEELCKDFNGSKKYREYGFDSPFFDDSAVLDTPSDESLNERPNVVPFSSVDSLNSGTVG